MRQRITSELKNEQISTLLEHLRGQGKLFTNWTRKQLDKFRDHFKFLQFKPKQQLTKRGEPVDFIGFLVKGQADVILDHKAQATLQEGSCIGYMSLLKMQGCEVQQFDIYGNQSGVMALIHKEDFRLLSKREPEFCAQIYLELCQKTLNTISQQYTDKGFAHQGILHNPQETQTKKILLFLDQLALTQAELSSLMKSSTVKKPQSQLDDKPTFRKYWNELEQKEKRLFVQYCSVINLEADVHLISQGQKGDQFFILVHGELQTNKKLQKNEIFRPGDTIGLSNFITEVGYADDIIARSKCVLIRVTRYNLQDMINIQGSIACNIISMLTRYQASKIRFDFERLFPDEKQLLQRQVSMLVEKLQNPEKTLSKKEQFTIPQLMGNYFELGIKKQELLTLDLADKEQVQSQVAPLYILDTYKSLIVQRGYQSNEIKDRKNPMFETGQSWFLRDKAEEQKQGNIKQKQEDKLLKKTGQYIPHNEQEITQSPNEGDIFEELNNEFYLLKAELEKANEYIFTLEQKTQDLKNIAQQKNEDHQLLQTKVKRYEMHKELLQLNLGSEKIGKDMFLKKKVSMFDTVKQYLYDIIIQYKQQASNAKKFKHTLNAADKMLSSLYHQN